jgi:uncharacterized protein
MTPARRLGLAFAAMVFSIVAGNFVVFAHAWRFTHFVAAGERTPGPERLSPGGRLVTLLTGVRVPRPRNDRSLADVGLVGRDLRVGEAAAWVVEGSGPGCVALFHGYAASRSSLLDEAAALHAMGHTVVLTDFPGSGDAEGWGTSLGWREAGVVRDVAALCEGHGPVVLYGKSMGSAAVLRAVGVLGVPADLLVLETPFDRLVTTVGHRFESMGLPAAPGAQLLVFWGGVQLGFDGFEHNPVDYAAAITTPTLLLAGENDARVRVQEVESIRAALAGPAILEVFAGAGHVSLLQADRALWLELVGGALAELSHEPNPPLQR